jgi:hypothetical protein
MEPYRLQRGAYGLLVAEMAGREVVRFAPAGEVRWVGDSRIRKSTRSHQE